MNTCLSTLQRPKIWHKAKVVALPKFGKVSMDPKNFRPVSLLCVGFIDLSAAYGTVNHKRLTSKFYNITRDYNMTQFIQCLLQNRQYFGILYNKNSRWGYQENGLPQGSVLAPMLYNINTNDQPIGMDTKSFIYADDKATAAQGKTFEEVERKLTIALEALSKYYDKNHLKPNTGKTQVCAFHLRNKDSKRKPNITCRSQQLYHCVTPKYLGVKLYRTLTYKAHCEDTELKICTWNETGHIVTGCLRPTPVGKMYQLMGIAPPDNRRRSIAENEKMKQESDLRHHFFDYAPLNDRD
ncbi:hypothetical protein PR048_009019 [Dryococelus australis]|uniref:Reverse transcriptase domain-containing protein n=1 Tax=Dryococelus australis TaxID=614101 RepID=A0ABQ9HYQ2_9NEOP|nr:hypothetical protein PR048_009019 [Dryococelus australis]